MNIVWVSESTLTELTLLGIAFVLSATIGFERQRRLKSAGLRTHTLVGLGAAVFTLVSAYGFQGVTGPDVVVDPSRIAAQIVTGIGFLGAGVIFVRRNSVSGLTTAASIWVTASIGMACGAGAPVLAALATALYLIAVWVLTKLGRWVRRSPGENAVLIRYREGAGALRHTLSVAADHGFEAVVTNTRSTSTADQATQIQATISLRSPTREPVSPLIAAVADVPGVHSIEYDESEND
ncbi:MgtC/SapB family protein [Ruania alba]|uniref:Putative Mg2+ transporter-C (MgtC) family protein n=1 Tax=Ruania alba TaxID=648782 RepID=A0A1H5L7Y5_9MICO|nr:MgtC/SapB family protein [Ruania alba]SEE73090.1 putative Mg2+ transporter-C (MgtC) family protein [Ruania alba]